MSISTLSFMFSVQKYSNFNHSKSWFHYLKDGSHVVSMTDLQSVKGVAHYWRISRYSGGCTSVTDFEGITGVVHQWRILRGLRGLYISGGSRGDYGGCNSSSFECFSKEVFSRHLGFLKHHHPSRSFAGKGTYLDHNLHLLFEIYFGFTTGSML